MEINNSWHLLSLFQINSKFKVCLVKQSGKNFRFILFIKIHLNIIIDKYQYGYSIFAKVYKNEFEKCNLLICNGWCVERWTRWNNVFKIKKSNIMTLLPLLYQSPMGYASYEKVENLYKSASMFRLMTTTIMTV